MHLALPTRLLRRMDTPIPHPLLLTRARTALAIRHDLMLVSLRSALLQFRQTLVSEPSADTRHASLSAVLRLSQLTSHALDLSLLPLPPLPQRDLLPTFQHTPISHSLPTPSPPEKPFQKRTFYRSQPIDERRAPVAEWNISRASSLCVTLSATSLDTLDSLKSGGTPTISRGQRVYGYSGYRIDDDGYAPFPVDESPHPRAPVTNELPRFFVPDIEEISIVRLRDSVFEIGIDGRIRRQKTTDSL